MKTFLKNSIVLFIAFMGYISYAQFPSQVGIPSSYRPIPGETYIISGWVSELQSVPVLTYQSTIKVTFTDSNGTFIPTENDYEFIPHGRIIDEWQRIIGEFTIPQNAANIHISLTNKSDHIPTGDGPNPTNSQAFFDDIRVCPFNGNLKSFVYDPTNQRLVAELDENNYATFYDYDKEGGLIRVKKETENGVFTIQETRSGNSKLNGN